MLPSRVQKGPEEASAATLVRKEPGVFSWPLPLRKGMAAEETHDTRRDTREKALRRADLAYPGQEEKDATRRDTSAKGWH